MRGEEEMILSVSRRTDIPRYFGQWFRNRIREGYLLVRNPVNPRQISQIDLSPSVVDCMVFWTKNPAGLIPYLDELEKYPYYFQFTLTGYGHDVEPDLPDKRSVLIPLFQQLSKRIGRGRMVWRYDPIFINSRYTWEYHKKAFREIASRLGEYTDQVVISFVDFYRKNRRNMAELGVSSPDGDGMRRMAADLAGIAREFGLGIVSCAEELDLEKEGVSHGSCIDRRRIEKILGCRLQGSADPGQRTACGCMESVEVGAYDTCPGGCRYCYASENQQKVKKNLQNYDVNSPLLCGKVEPDDVVTVRKMRSLKEMQMNFDCILSVKKI